MKKRTCIWVDVKFKENVDKLFSINGEEDLSMTQKTKRLNKMLEGMIYGKKFVKG